MSANSYVNINNSNIPFLSIKRHQKEPLGCVATNDSYNKFIDSCGLACNSVTKLIAEGEKKSKARILFEPRKS